MVSDEVRPQGGSRGEGQDVLQPKPKKELVRIAKDKGERANFLKERKTSIEEAKDKFKSRLVGGKKEHKDRLDEIISQSTQKLREIERLPEKERERALEKLEKDSEKDITELIKNIEKDIGKTGEEEMGGMARERGGETKLIWGKIQDTEKAYRELEQELSSGAPNADRLEFYQRKLINRQSELATMMEEWDYKGPLGIRTFYEQAVAAEIREAKIGGREALEVRDEMELLKVRILNPNIKIEREEIDRQLEKVSGLLEVGRLSGEEASRLKANLEEIKRRIDLQGRVRSEVSRVREGGGVDSERVAEFRRKNANLEGLGNLSDEQVAVLASSGVESNPGAISEAVEIAKLARGFAGGEYGSMWQAFTRWNEISANPFSPDQLLRDGKRGIIEAAMIRIVNNPEGAELKVTQKDIENWVKERMHRVIASQEESTGYSARQFLGEIAGVLESKDLHLDREIADFINSHNIIREGRPVNIDDIVNGEKINIYSQRNEFIGSFDNKDKYSAFIRQVGRFAGEGHVPRASEHFREQMSAVIIVNEWNNAYRHSVGSQDMVRISGMVETEQLSRMLDLENVKKEVRGRLKFYEVAVDERGRQKTLGFDQLNDTKEVLPEILEGMSSGEYRQGELQMVVIKADGSREAIDSNNFKKLLTVEGAAAVTPGDILDLLNQSRFARGILSTQEEVREKFQREVVREAINLRLGLVNVDGEINLGKIQELVAGEYGDGARFELKNQAGESVDSNKIRLTMLAEKVGDKPMNVKMCGEREKEFKDKEGKVLGKLKTGGIIEDENSLDDMFNEHKMVFSLAEGMWKTSGMAVGLWDPTMSGDVKEWHFEDLHFVRTAAQYGIGSSHFWDAVNLDFFDFISEEKDNLMPGFFGEHTLKDVNGKDLKGDDLNYRKALIKMLVEDRDGYMMPREKMINLYSLASEKEMKDLLMEKAKFVFDDAKGTMLVNKHWKAINQIDWSAVMGETEGLSEGQRKGFEGLVNFVKRNYRYVDMSWGREGKSGHGLWSQRVLQKAKWLVSVDEYKGKMLAWFGRPDKVDLILDAVSTPIKYGKSDLNRKIQLMMRRQHEFFKRVIIPDVETIGVDPHTNVINANSWEIDEWDGTIRYKKTKVLPGACLAKNARGIKPFTAGQFAEQVEQVRRSGKVKPRYADEMMGRIAELGKTQEWIDMQLEKAGTLGKALKPFNHILFGANIPGWTIGKWRIYGDMRWAGILGLLKKWIEQLMGEVWAVKGEIISGTLKSTGEELGKGLK